LPTDFPDEAFIWCSFGGVGTLCRECLDRALFWTTTDLEAKLLDFQHYYNEHRTHAGRKGHPLYRMSTPIAHWQISVVIDGRSIVKAYTKRRLPRDFSNSPWTGSRGAGTDNLLRWLERGGNSYWFWLCSGSVAMVVLFGILALVAQFFYWADIVKGLNDQLVEGSGHRDID
jgi:hypothetical protein